MRLRSWPCPPCDGIVAWSPANCDCASPCRRAHSRAAIRKPCRRCAKIGGARRFCHRAPSLYQPTCKPGSVGRDTDVPRVTAIPLGRRSPGASSNLPGRQDPDRSRDCSRAVPIRSCSRWGLPCRRRCRRRGALLPHLFTLAATIRYVPRRFVLCGTVPEASPREGLGSAGRYPAPLIRGARTFLPGGLSALAGAAVRPTDALGMGTLRPSVKGGASHCLTVCGRPSMRANLRMQGL